MLPRPRSLLLQLTRLLRPPRIYRPPSTLPRLRSPLLQLTRLLRLPRTSRLPSILPRRVPHAFQWPWRRPWFSSCRFSRALCAKYAEVVMCVCVLDKRRFGLLLFARGILQGCSGGVLRVRLAKVAVFPPPPFLHHLLLKVCGSEHMVCLCLVQE